MVLGYGGFFGLSSTEYREKLKHADINDLKQQEIVKTRTRIAAGLTAYLGLLATVPSYGGSLVMSAVQARRMRVAHRKLELIRQELTRRGVLLPELRKRDIAVPATGVAIGAGVGMGLDVALGSFIAAGDFFVGGPSTTSEDIDASITEELHAILARPDALSEEFSAGFHEEGDLLSAGAHGISGSNGVDNTTALTMYASASHLHLPDAGSLTSDAYIPSAISADEAIAKLVGEQLGLAAAVALESNAGDVVISQLAVWIIEAFEDLPDYSRCSRGFGTTWLVCDGCSKDIDTGTYMRKYHSIT
jgi:hypothetical protein